LEVISVLARSYRRMMISSQPLPAWIHEVYRLHQRMVDIEGYVALHSNRYSVPVEWIGRRVEACETKSKIEIQLDARRLVTHRRMVDVENQRIMLQVIENTLVLAATRRLIRPAGAQSLGTIRSLAYLLPVIEEVLNLRVNPDYFDYLRSKLARAGAQR
jgi:hypothetical protein